MLFSFFQLLIALCKKIIATGLRNCQYNKKDFIGFALYCTLFGAERKLGVCRHVKSFRNVLLLYKPARRAPDY